MVFSSVLCFVVTKVFKVLAFTYLSNDSIDDMLYLSTNVLVWLLISVYHLLQIMKVEEGMTPEM